MSDKAHWLVSFKQVDNGYLLKVQNCNTYKETESVYPTFASAVEAFRKASAHIEGDVLRLATGKELSDDGQEDDVPY